MFMLKCILKVRIFNVRKGKIFFTTMFTPSHGSVSFLLCEIAERIKCWPVDDCIIMFFFPVDKVPILVWGPTW